MNKQELIDSAKEVYQRKLKPFIDNNDVHSADGTRKLRKEMAIVKAEVVFKDGKKPIHYKLLKRGDQEALDRADMARRRDRLRGRGVAGRNYLINYFGPQIEERRRNPNRQDMFSQFCRATRDDGEYMSDGEIIDHMNFLMMAAHDTITSSATSLIYHLATNPAWQEKLREEIFAVTGGPDGDGNPRPLDYDDLAKLDLTEMAFKESLRMIPPVPSMPRRALREFEYGGYRIPAGAMVGINIYWTHHSEEYWENPFTFDPMRFTPEQVKARHKYAWVPFGGGAHMCLGLHFAYMQVKILLAQLLQRYSIEIAEGYQPEWQPWPIPKPKDGLKVTFRSL